MAWTTPLTAVANSALTAAQWNSSVRDNLLVTAPALATTAGGYFTVTGTNEIVQRVGDRRTVDTPETTTSTSWTDLPTFGPSVTCNTGPLALVLFGCRMYNTSTENSYMSLEVPASAGGATPSEARAVSSGGYAGGTQGASQAIFFDDLTPGANTFTCKYQVSGGTATFASRRLVVLPY